MKNIIDKPAPEAGTLPRLLAHGSLGAVMRFRNFASVIFLSLFTYIGPANTEEIPEDNTGYSIIIDFNRCLDQNNSNCKTVITDNYSYLYRCIHDIAYKISIKDSVEKCITPIQNMYNLEFTQEFEYSKIFPFEHYENSLWLEKFRAVASYRYKNNGYSIVYVVSFLNGYPQYVYTSIGEE